MTDETTTETPTPPKTLSVFTCYNPRNPTRSCHALIENTDEERRLHREWHDSLHSKEEGQRKAIKARDAEIAKLHDAIGEYKRAVDAYEKEVAGVHGEVQRVEAPTPAPALEIVRDGYTDDELADQPDDEDDEDDWALPRQTPNPFADAADQALASVPDLGEALAGEPAESAADEPAESAADDLDDDDALATSSAAAYPQHLGLDDASIGLGTRQPWATR